jgi:hypothetical protein
VSQYLCKERPYKIKKGQLFMDPNTLDINGAPIYCRMIEVLDDIQGLVRTCDELGKSRPGDEYLYIATLKPLLYVEEQY